MRPCGLARCRECATLAFHPVAKAGIGNSDHDLPRQPLDDRGRRSGRCKHGKPGVHLIIWNARFCRRRHIRHLRRSLVRGNREHLDLAGFQQRIGDPDAGRDHVNDAGKEVRVGGGCALLRHVNDIDVGQDLEPLSSEMMGAADTDRAVVQLARIGLGLGDKLLQRVS